MIGIGCNWFVLIGNDCIGIFMWYGVKFIVNFEFFFEFLKSCVFDNFWFMFNCFFCIDYGYVEV